MRLPIVDFAFIFDAMLTRKSNWPSLERVTSDNEARVTEQQAALFDAAGQAFYNTPRFTLRDLKSRGSRFDICSRYFCLCTFRSRRL
jgi:hypothetical protein